MDAVRPSPMGDASVIKLLRPVIFSGIEGAVAVYPNGLTRVHLAQLLGWLGPWIALDATDPLPATPLYVAVTPDDIRLFGRPMFSSPFEIGRWKKRSYRASLLESGLRFRLVLEVDNLGRIRLNTRLRPLAASARQVLELIVQNASGPATLL